MLRELLLSGLVAPSPPFYPTEPSTPRGPLRGGTSPQLRGRVTCFFTPPRGEELFAWGRAWGRARAWAWAWARFQAQQLDLEDEDRVGRDDHGARRLILLA